VSFKICTPDQILFRFSDQGGRRLQGHVERIGEKRNANKNPKKREQLEDTDVDGRISKWILDKLGERF
jgi:hypothetical protein